MSNEQKKGDTGMKKRWVKNYFCSKYFVDPMPSPPWEVALLMLVLACGLMGVVWFIQSVW